MVWPFSSSSSKSNEETSYQSPVRSSERISSRLNQPEEIHKVEKPEKTQRLLLEDTEPRFNNGPTPNPSPPLKEAVSSISTDSFRFANLVKMPCFREAGLTGLSALGVLGTIIFITQKSPKKAVNWGIGGLLLGSTVSWEQCRSKRRKELEFALKARETVASKQKPMMNKQEENLTNENLENRKEVKSWWSRG